MADGGSRLGGLPLLSGPPPALSDTSRDSDACRKCNKEFNVFNIFNRPKQCNHCGYLYCSTCTDYHALMPRNSASSAGYDTKPVCAFCIDYLNITASGRAHLKDLPVARLKQYIKAYGIRVNRAVEKDDYIDAILSARGNNGCLSADAERFYRKHSVPNQTGGPPRSFFSRPANDMNARGRTSQAPPRTNSRQNTFARPDLDPNYRRPPATTQPTPTTSRPTSQPPLSRARYSDPSNHAFPTPHSTSHPTNSNVPPATTTASAPPPRSRTTSTVPPPSLDELLGMSSEAITGLSISTLKAILFANHVNARLILEKAELVTKVNVLVEEERHVRERHRLAEEQERELARLAEQERQEELERERQRREAPRAPTPDAVLEPTAEPAPNATEAFAPEDVPKPSTPPHPPASPPKIPASTAFAERSGLCVICQDEEATIVIVDCGHLCLCRDCSGVVMKSTKECPLCRTRIVTEQRLLRVFRT